VAKSKVDKLDIEYVALDEIKGADRNPKDHDIGAIMESFERFGFVAPGIRNEATGKIVVGHGRAEALRQLKESGAKPPRRIKVTAGQWMVPVIVGVSFDSDVEAEAYLVADNRLTELGNWDMPLLAAVLQDAAKESLGGTGFTGDDVDDILALLGTLPPPPGEGGEGGENGGGGEGDALWPVISVRVPPEVFHQYRKVLAHLDGKTEAEKFSSLVSRVIADA
jgi:hypothetical protein